MKDLLISDFSYFLPASHIAQNPTSERTNSRLMVIHEHDPVIYHTQFKDLTHHLVPGDVLVMNDARVIPARLFGTRLSGGRIEILILDGWRGRKTRVLLKPARRIRENEVIRFQENWQFRVLERQGECFTGEFEGDGDFERFLFREGVMPLPPYIKRSEHDLQSKEDACRYQTVFARSTGAVAAPTAGLHFSQELMDRLANAGVKIVFLTLFVGWGTFKPIVVEKIIQHKMDDEVFCISRETAATIREAKQNHRVIAVGTTTSRALESWAQSDPQLHEASFQSTNLFISPGYSFRMIDGLITNFHLPKSSLLIMVSAFIGREKILDAYRTAIEMDYRFFSYGDAMAIFKSNK